jgi:aldehyde dehydrogenase (NAD+)
MSIVLADRTGPLPIKKEVQTDGSEPSEQIFAIFEAMNELVESQRSYFQQGHTRSLAFRKQQLRLLHDLLMDHEKELADAIYKDFRKSFYATVENEISLPCGEIKRAIRNLNRWSRPKYVRTNLVNFPASSRVVPVPYGVSLVIGPWNYPYMLSLIPAISSLAAGNTVILKPSEITSHSSAALARLVNTHFPRNVFHVVEGGEEVATELLKERFDKIFFTGSSRVGRIIMQAAALHLTPVTLELGGKNPVIVMPDSPLKKTARRLAWGKLHNNGSACVAPDHVYVHRSVKDQLIEELQKSFTSILDGDPRNSPIVPRIINDREFDRITGLIDHGKIVAGGQVDRGDRYIEPTLLDGVELQDPIMQEEIFGPLLPLITYDHIDEVISQINTGPSPLALYIFTSEIAKAKKILLNVSSGGGMVNEVVLHFVNMNTPFGGVGASGMGNYHGKAGFTTFSHQKTILAKPFWFDLFLKYPPYRTFHLHIIKAIFGRSIRSFWK